MRRTRSTSTSDSPLQERRSLRLTRDNGTTETNGNAKLKRNSLYMENFVRSSPRRKMVKLASDIENNKKDSSYLPHKKYSSISSKHFTRASKRTVSSICVIRSDKSSDIFTQDAVTCKGSKKRSNVADDRVEIPLSRADNCSYKSLASAKNNVKQRASSCQENGQPISQNGNTSQSECKPLTRASRRRHCQCGSFCSGSCCTDRPVTRLSSAKQNVSITKEPDFVEQTNSITEHEIETADTSGHSDSKGNIFQDLVTQKEEENGTPIYKNGCMGDTVPGIACDAKHNHDDSKEKLNIEELFEIGYSDMASNDFVGFQSKRKMNLRSSGVHCDPNYYALSLELIKKSRSKSLSGNFSGKQEQSTVITSSEENHCSSLQESAEVCEPGVGTDLNTVVLQANITDPDLLTNDEKMECIIETKKISRNLSQKFISSGIDSIQNHDNCNIEVTETESPEAKTAGPEELVTEDHVDVNLPLHSPGFDKSPTNTSNLENGNEFSVKSSTVCNSSESVEPSCAPQNSVEEQVLTKPQTSPTPRRRRGNFKQRAKEPFVEKPRIKMLFHDPSEPPPLFIEEAVPKSDVYHFESDHVALKHNKDYQGFLKAVALLEAQRHQCLQDIETIKAEKTIALAEPVAYVEKLQTKSMVASYCHPQTIATLPNINWLKYASQYGTFSNVFGNDTTAAGTSTKPVTRKVKLKFGGGVPMHSSSTTSETNQLAPSQSTRVTWTVEEQLKLEELLLKYPSEQVEFNRFRKIAAELGNRTPLQVQSRVQKYFIKLARAGLPVPGVRPRSGRLTRDTIGQSKRARTHPQQSYLRASTFFPQLHCPVQMNGDEDDCNLPCTSSKYNSDTLDNLASDDEDIPEELRDCDEYIEILWLKKLRKNKLGNPINSSKQVLAQHTGYACDMCDSDPIQGVRYHCIDCPQDTCVDLCQSCIHLHGQFVTDSHKPSHRMEPVYESQNFLDDDYMKFDSCSGEYNYLDPNFHPASI